MQADYVVVGGGIIGLFTAWMLAEKPGTVLLLERGKVGREASWAGAGILSPLQPWSEPDAVLALAQWSQKRYPELAAVLHAATGIDPEWSATGLLVLGAGPEAALAPWLARTPHRVEHFTPAALAALEPALKLIPGEQALCLHDVAQIRNPRLLRALRVALQDRGVIVQEHRTVSRILTADAQVLGVLGSAGERIDSDCVIVAGGAWSTALLTEFGAVPSIPPVRGQILLYQTARPLIRHVILDSGHYFVPRRDGHLLVGSTVEHVGYDASTTTGAATELREFASSRLPALEGLDPVGHWAGLRPGSRDGIPTIGAHPSIHGLYVNFGHFRNGVTLAPASARLLTNLIQGQTPIVAPEPYAWATSGG